MNKIINIKVSEYAIGKNGVVIETSSVGSCIVICLYDEVAKVGSMAHCMLPHRPIENIIKDQNERKAKYVDEAIDLMIKEIEDNGGAKINLKAKIIGGSEMFKILARNHIAVGQENINMARNRLNEFKIPIISEDTGGSVGRAASFNTENGVLSVSVRM